MRRLTCIMTVILLMCCLTSCGKQKDLPIEEQAPSIYTSENGVAVIKPSTQEKPDEIKKSIVTPETVWEEQSKPSADVRFNIPDKKILKKDGSLGTISIQKIGLRMSVFEADDTIGSKTTEVVLKKGAAHFKSTSMWNGTVGVSAHNDGVPDAVSFGRLHELKIGDNITYTTEFGERSYEVSEIKEISEDDWSYLSRSDDNRITLITCVSGKSDKRLMVQGIEKE